MSEQKSFFDVYVIGEIVGAKHFDRIPISCQYELCVCDPWYTSSPTTGSSAYDLPQDSNVYGHVFQLPFEFQLNSSGIQLWPSLLLRLFTICKGKRQLYATGYLAIPCHPGHYVVKVQCFSYNQDTFYKYARTFLLKQQVENADQIVIQDFAGEVEVSVFVTLEKFDEFREQWKTKTAVALAENATQLYP